MSVTTPTVYLKLEDLTDATGTITNLTNNGVATFVAAKVGNGVNLVNASSQFLSHVSTTDLQVSGGDFSITCWVKLAAIPSADRGIICKDNNTNSEFFVWLHGQTPEFRFRVNNQIQSATTFGAPSTGVWYFIASTWTASSKTTAISVNNGAVDSTVQASAGATNTVDFQIGSLATVGLYLDGIVDEVGIWKGHVLTASEISQLYNGGKGTTYPFPSGGLIMGGL